MKEEISVAANRLCSSSVFVFELLVFARIELNRIASGEL